MERLENGRLLLLLDSLLETGSVSLTARQLGFHPSAVSRKLAVLRKQLGDPLFSRSARGLVPTTHAEQLRPAIRLLASGIDTVFQKSEAIGTSLFDAQWNVAKKEAVPGLSFVPMNAVEGAPSSKELEKRLERFDNAVSPHERLLKYCSIISTGGGKRRTLTTDEAHDAMEAILGGKADQLQIATLLSIIQYRGVTATELAGFIRSLRKAVRNHFNVNIGVDLDWPCYASPHDQRPPWYIHAARLLSKAGYRVLLHGSSGSGSASGRHETVFGIANILVCDNAEAARLALETHNIAYVPLSSLLPQAYRLLALRGITGMRNPIHDAVYMSNPANAHTSLLGVSKASYRELHRDTAKILDDQSDLAIVSNVRGAAQINPSRSTTIFRLVNSTSVDVVANKIPHLKIDPLPYTTTLEFWQGIWTGEISDTKVEQIITSTAAAALMALSENAELAFDDVLREAERLWLSRHNNLHSHTRTSRSMS